MIQQGLVASVARWTLRLDVPILLAPSLSCRDRWMRIYPAALNILALSHVIIVTDGPMLIPVEYITM